MATVMPEWRKVFEAEDSDFGKRGLGAMEVCSSTGMGAPGALLLGTGDHGPKTDRSRPRSVPVNALVAINFRIVATPKLKLGRRHRPCRLGPSQLTISGFVATLVGTFQMGTSRDPFVIC